MRSLLLAALVCAGCATVAPEPPPLASARASEDLRTYTLRRIALLPLLGERLDAQHARTLQDALALELARVSPFELVQLRPEDVEETPGFEPHRSGGYEPRTVLELARRYRLDGVLVGTVTRLEPYAPQALGMGLELVACETGRPIWSGRLSIDGSRADVRASLEAFQRRLEPTHAREAGAQLTGLSPALFARFAASEMARVF